MLNDGNRSIGGNLSEEHRKEINNLISLFSQKIESILLEKKYKRSSIRSQLSCSILVFMDAKTFWIVGQNHLGMPSSIYLDVSNTINSLQHILNIANDIYSFTDAFVIPFSRNIINMSIEERDNEILAIVQNYIETELRRNTIIMNTITINPIFGPALYQVYDNQAFVLMPFENKLTSIYKEIIKPLLQNNEFNMICRRADEINSNNVIMKDIWKSICEARLIIADITDCNPNVMYELGIAHTLGKDTILITQKSKSHYKLPFDLSHIRTIIYENKASGGKQLENQLADTLRNILFS